jgi:predicted GIY-YIG superfamily endonuclease
MNLYYTIYKLINNIDDMVYVGVTQNPRGRLSAHRINGSNIKMRQLLTKINKFDLNMVQLACTFSKENAEELEQHFIIEYDSINNGYNVNEGGFTCKPTRQSVWASSLARGKINYEIADQIRAEYAAGNTTLLKLSLKYGICSSTIWKIARLQRWVR